MTILGYLASIESDKCTFKASPSFAWLRGGRLTKYSLSFSNTWSRSSFQAYDFCNTLKNGKHLSDKPIEEAICPVSFCTSFMLRGGNMSIMACIFSELAFIPLSKTMKARNLPDSTPRAHFIGFNFILYRHKMVKASRRSSKWCSGSLLLMSKSSM